MKTAVLRRTEMGDAGTFGTLEIDGAEFVTGELPDRDNAPEISCIPAGVYLCKWTPSNRLKRETYQVMDVPGRTGIRLHPANFMGDVSKGLKAEVNGCIALGAARVPINGQEAVGGSRDTVKKFEALLGGEDFELQIIDEYLEAGEPAQTSIA